MAFRKCALKINYDFYGNYKKNLDKIIQARDLSSDTHRIKSVEAQNEWVDKQLNFERRAAAKDLLDNTHYITFNMIFSGMRQLIATIYTPLQKKLEAGQLAVISLYAGEPNTDTYFMAVIAVYFIRLLGFPDPSIIYHTTRLGAIPEETIIYVNDISYHGGEISDLFTLIAKQNRKSNFIIGLLAVTETARRHIEALPVTLHYIHHIPSLKTVIGITRFLRICYYFAPGNEGCTQVSVYFDHCCGSISCSFIKTLILGPILPLELGYIPLAEHNIYSLIRGITEHGTWHINPLPLTSQEREQESSTLIAQDEEFKQYMSEIDALAEKDAKMDGQKDNIIQQIQFHPILPNYVLSSLEEYSTWSYFDFMCSFRRSKDKPKLTFLSENIKAFYKNTAYILK